MLINGISNYKNFYNNSVNSIKRVNFQAAGDTFSFKGNNLVEDGQWFVFGRYDKDPLNFQNNAKLLKKVAKKGIFSGRYDTINFLKKYSYHVYMVGNKPAFLLRSDGKNISDIRSNINGTFDYKYLDIINKYISANNLKLSKKASSTLSASERTKEKYLKITSDLKDAVNRQDNEAIFEYFGIITDTDRHGDMTISEYKQPDDGITFKDLGIDEAKLISHVVTIEGDADFRKSSLTSTGPIEYIGGNAIFSSSNIKSLDNLEVIEGNANFNASKVNDIGKLEFIGGNANFRNSGIEFLKNLEHIGKNAFFRDSKVKDLGKLNYIGGKITFINSPLKKKMFAFGD